MMKFGDEILKVSGRDFLRRKTLGERACKLLEVSLVGFNRSIAGSAINAASFKEGLNPEVKGRCAHFFILGHKK
jgi:hypothetical protein